jgi:hypothetical protein
LFDVRYSPSPFLLRDPPGPHRRMFLNMLVNADEEIFSRHSDYTLGDRRKSVWSRVSGSEKDRVVIPAKPAMRARAGIQEIKKILDSRFREKDR